MVDRASYVSYDFFGIMGSMPQIIFAVRFQTLMLVLFNYK